MFGRSRLLVRRELRKLIIGPRSSKAKVLTGLLAAQSLAFYALPKSEYVPELKPLDKMPVDGRGEAHADRVAQEFARQAYPAVAFSSTDKPGASRGVRRAC